VPIDFRTEELGDALSRAGFDYARTFWILEGVTEYIGAAAVDATFRFVADASAADSKIAFTYTDLGAIDGTKRIAGASSALIGSKLFGEKMLFGFDPRELPDYLAAHDLVLLEDVAGLDYQSRYFEPSKRNLHANDYERAALAGVREHGDLRPESSQCA
jgi:methyltransferase (TIGR00027 family)